MGSKTVESGIWDAEHAVRRMGADHFRRYRDTYRRVAVMANALSGVSFQSLYSDPARTVLGTIRANVDRPGMVSEKLLSAGEQQQCVQLLQAIESVLAGLPADLSLYQLSTTAPDPGLANLVELFRRLDAASSYVCVPFMRPGYDPVASKPMLDDFLGLVGSYTYKDLYERPPAAAIKPAFNRVMVRAKRAGFLVELRGIRKPACASYVSDPTDDRWDVRSCVAPENAVLFKNVHLKINTMAYLMAGLNYSDFFDKPLTDSSVLAHFKARAQADQNYWFTALEKERIVAALDAIIAFLNGSGSHQGLTFREIYTNPEVPAEVLIQFRRILDVKPEICLPFMEHTWDHAEAAELIDVFLVPNGGRSLKQLYVDPADPPKESYTQSEFERILKQREATKVLLSKSNDLVCVTPGNCDTMIDEYCSTAPNGNCRP